VRVYFGYRETKKLSRREEGSTNYMAVVVAILLAATMFLR